MDEESIEVNCQDCGLPVEVTLPLLEAPVLCAECASYAEAGGGESGQYEEA